MEQKTNKTITDAQSNKSSEKLVLRNEVVNKDIPNVRKLLRVGLTVMAASIATEVVSTYVANKELHKEISTIRRIRIEKADPPLKVANLISKVETPTLNINQVTALTILKKEEGNEREDVKISSNVAWGAVAGLLISTLFLLLGMSENGNANKEYSK